MQLLVGHVVIQKDSIQTSLPPALNCAEQRNQVVKYRKIIERVSTKKIRNPNAALSQNWYDIYHPKF